MPGGAVGGYGGVVPGDASAAVGVHHAALEGLGAGETEGLVGVGEREGEEFGVVGEFSDGGYGEFVETVGEGGGAVGGPGDGGGGGGGGGVVVYEACCEACDTASCKECPTHGLERWGEDL